MKHYLLTFVVALLAASFSPAEETLKLPAKEKFHLFLLVGQSNMAGRGVVDVQDKTPDPRILMLNKAGEWVSAADPLHFDKPAAGTGLGKTFALRIADANPGITIGLIPCAVGGSPIDSWKLGEFYAPTKSHPWDDSSKRSKIALKSGVLKGILWHQGESDSKEPLASAYEEKLHDLVKRFRKELEAPEVPFIVGQMGQFVEVPWDAAHKKVDLAHQDIVKKMPFTSYVSADGLKHKGDKVHFDAASYREFGKRYATAYLKAADPMPPKGFRSIFNGKDLAGWYGWNPHSSTKLKDEKLEANLKKQKEEFPKTWKVDAGELVNGGDGPYATSAEEFGDIELLIEYKTVAKADSGIYLRGTPQVQIWDINQPSLEKAPDRNPNRGSGGLFNNTAKSKGRDPLVVADKPFGEWNSFRIKQVGAQTWVWLNDKLVVDNATMENFWDRKMPLPTKGPIMLQTHGGEIRWRNIFVRDINAEEAKKLLGK